MSTSVDNVVHSIKDLAAAARGRRVELGQSQAAVARRAGVSRQWINAFEQGKPTSELGLTLRLLDALGLELHVSAPGARAAPEPRSSIDLDLLLDEYRGR